MKATIINIANEVLNGSTINTNATFLSLELGKLGYEVNEVLAIADGYDALSRTLDCLADDVQHIILTGGLGPTPDDTTRFDIARKLGLNLIEKPELKDDIIKIMGTDKGQEFIKENRVQTIFPESAEILRNPVGTAAGFHISHKKKHFYFVPGVPREMKVLFKDEIAPRLAPTNPLYRKELMTYGIGESLQTRLLADVVIPTDITFASLPSSGELLIRLSGSTLQAKLIDDCFEEILEALKDHKEAWTSLCGEKLLTTISKELKAQSKTVAVAESCTGGGLGAALTSVDGSSQFFNGGVIAYQNSIKTDFLEVSTETINKDGAVSESCALQMAKGLEKHFKSDLNISITGIAGPNGGTKEKPVGTVCFGLSSKAGTLTETKHFRGDREQVRLRAQIHACYLLFKELNK